MDIHSFAPDAKYMTMDELIENGEWMDHIIDTLRNPAVTRKTIASHCKVYSCSKDDKILTLPFYSLFEDKYVYLPMGFIDQIYATNGCCVGNTRQEAWIHAFSEILERHSTLKTMSSNKPAPLIPEETLQKYPIVSKILSEIRKNNDYHVEVFDFSHGIGYPVVSTRIISKKTKKYIAKVAADPVFEIALHRNLTELFQGRNIHNVHMSNSGRILPKPLKGEEKIKNIVNQLETGDGLFSADYFTNELCETKASEFDDNSNKTNAELIEYVTDVFRKTGKPVYIRNCSFLGFPCYRFVVPGFSEAYIDKLSEIIPQYAFGHDAAGIFKNVQNATDNELNMFLFYDNMLRGTFSRYHNFSHLSGLPFKRAINLFLAYITRAYIAYRLKKYSDVIKHLHVAINGAQNEDDKEYLSCIIKYIELLSASIPMEKIKVILPKFNYKKDTDRLFGLLDKGQTPFDEFLVSCDIKNCSDCKHKDVCNYDEIRELTINAGKIYREFTNGQSREEFKK